MAKLIPNTYPEKTVSGEKIIFETLEEAKGTGNWVVMHSLDIPEHKKKTDGEADFTLLVPDQGIIIMEIKSSPYIEVKNGQWYFGKIKEKRESPFKQAVGNKHSIKENLTKESDKRFNNILFGHCVIFTNWVATLPKSLEYKPWQYLTKPKLYDQSGKISGTTLISFIRNIFKNIEKQFPERYSPDASRFDLNLLKKAINYMRPNVAYYMSPKTRKMQKDEEIKRYTAEQFSYLEDFLPSNTRTVINGPAGTGKSLIAIETARRTSANKKKVFLTCYNQLFGEWLKKQVEPDPNIICDRFIGFMMNLANIPRKWSPRHNRIFFSELPNVVHEYLTKHPLKEEEKFDEIIIDEAQDLCTEEFFLIYGQILKGGLNDGTIRMFGDFKEQQIFQKQTSFNELLKSIGVEPFAEYVLKINCRNREHLGEKIANYCGIKNPYKKFLRKGGVPPKVIYYNYLSDQKEKVMEIIEKLSKEKFYSQELQFLTFDARNTRMWSDFLGKEKALSKFKGSRNSFSVLTIARYKGLDNKIIIILDTEDIISEKNRTLYYIGISRSLDRAYIFANKKNYKEMMKRV